MLNFNLEICLVVLEAVKLGREGILEVHLNSSNQDQSSNIFKGRCRSFPTDGYEHAKRFI